VTGRSAPLSNIAFYRAVIFLTSLFIACLAQSVVEAASLDDFRADYDLAQVMPGADRLGPSEGSPPSAIAYKGEKEIGYLFLNSDAVSSIGYSGKPIHIVVGIKKDGTITGARMVKHHEPIVLIGIPVRKIHDFIDGYIGLNVLEYLKHQDERRQIDIVSGATVTVMIIDDTIIRAAIKILRARGAAAMPKSDQPTERVELIQTPAEKRDWLSLIGDGSVRRLLINVEDVNQAFIDSGNQAAIERPNPGQPNDLFIELYAGLVTIPTIGENLIGAREYANLQKVLAPKQASILIFAKGLYSFKGSGYVRGGIFDRIQLIQGDISVRFRDKWHKRLGEVYAEGAGDFPEVGLFYIPLDSGFDAAKPWRLELLVQRPVGPIKKAFTTFSLNYAPPETYLKRTPIVTAGNDASVKEKAVADRLMETPLWQKIWDGKVVDIAVLAIALAVLTTIFFFQDWFVRRPKLFDRIRLGFLAFTVVWIGFYANAQLSVVNVLTFTSSLLSGFSWEFFLMEPLIFILWGAVAASLLFWGRGVYCGWLCPFGALQELINKLARALKIPQIKVPWALHERLWPIKYVVFLGIFGLSLYSFELAETAAEIEPFKTAIVLKFARGWPFVMFAIGLLIAGLFIERFYCRYLCPLGGALGIPGRIRMNDWLKRYKDCGSPCQICAADCMVQAIRPEGQINPNECLQCLGCQTLYYDDTRCPVMVDRRKRTERRAALRNSKQTIPNSQESKKAEAISPAVKNPPDRS
jgi:NosR/NirI family nitrous oxide reductase transcriptional regulator